MNRCEYKPTAEIERAWQPVTFIDGVPYVRLAYTIANDGFMGVTEMTMEREGLFKLARRRRGRRGAPPRSPTKQTSPIEPKPSNRAAS